MSDHPIDTVQSPPALQTLVEFLPDSTLYFDRALRCTYVNPAFERLTGLAAARCLGRRIDEFELWGDPAGRAEQQQRLEQVFANGREAALRAAVATPAGACMWDIRHAPVLAADHTVIGVLWVARDITAQWQVERQQLAEIEAIYTTAPVGLCVLDKELRYQRINETLATLNGFPAAYCLGRTPREVLSPALADRVEPLLQQVLATGQAARHVEVSVRASNDPTTAHTTLDSYYPLKNEAGEVIGVNVVVTEITHLKEAERRLQHANATLEEQVQARTAELVTANATMQAKITALQQGEERYRNLVEMMPDALFVHQQNQIVYGNPAFLRLVGATAPEQVLGRPPLAFVHPASQDLVRARIKHLLAEGGVLPPVDTKIVRLDGTTLEVESASSRYQEGETNAIQVIFRDITQRKQAELQLLNHRLATAQENERKRLARELHDQVGQNLTALTLGLSFLQERFVQHQPNAGELLHGFADAQTLVAQINSTVRELLNELHPPLLTDFGLLAGLRWYSDRLARRAQLPIQVSGTEPTPKLSDSVALALFRIAQEALTNVIRHAGASQVEVQLWADGATIHLLIEDNGCGFNLAELTDPMQHPHWGLLRMQERAAAVGGQITIESQPLRGTVVHVEILHNPAP